MAQLVYLPQKGINSPRHLPSYGEMPPGDFRALCFPFPATGIMATASQEIGMREEFLLFALTAVAGAAAGTPDFSLLFYHTHVTPEGAIQRQLLWKPIKYTALCGKANNPAFLRSPYLLAQGDILTCEIANASQNAGAYVAADLYVGLWGVHPDE